MSGSSSGGGSVGGAGGGSTGGTGAGGTGTQFTDCTQILEETTLASPVPEVLRRLQVNNVLQLQLHNPPRGPLLAVYEGETAGSITTTALTNLIACINDGHQFVAIVRAVNGGKCDVQIRSAGSV